MKKKQKENSHEDIKWSEMVKQTVQAKEVYSTKILISKFLSYIQTRFDGLNCYLQAFALVNISAPPISIPPGNTILRIVVWTV